jgi:sulfate adenylyltransferase large subunit
MFFRYLEGGGYNMIKTHLKFVIVGHVDHGKSTLIGRLLFDTDSLPREKIEEVKRTCEALGRELEFAYVMDHLEEERMQGLTIDTAQTFFKTPLRDYVIIDAPGHREFIKNMITGASQAEAAILIVDAYEGVREQTKRHAYILSMLGLDQVIVVINKMDLVDYSADRFNMIKTELNEFLASIDTHPTYIIPISAKYGDNIATRSTKMDWYSNLTVLEALDTFKPRVTAVTKPLRFPIQDVYRVGDKRILVGRVEAGRIEAGQSILILPNRSETKVKSIEILWKDKHVAEAGESIGITIDDPIFIERGAIACTKDAVPTIVNRFDAYVFWLSKEPLNMDEKLELRLATQEVGCRIITIKRRINSATLETIEEDATNLQDAEVGLLVIETDRPIVIENFNIVQELGRFVLVRGYDVCAGGIIT